MSYVLHVLAVLFVAATALPFVRKPYWWVRMFDFPRAQLAVGGVGVLAASTLRARGATALGRGMLASLSAAVAYQVARMAPYTPLYPVQVRAAEASEPGRTLRLVVSNVLMQNRDAERWLRVMRDADPDVLLAVETDARWAREAAALHERYPHRVEVPQDNTYGMLLLSKWPIVRYEVRRLVEEEVPSVWAEIAMPAGPRFRLVALHPRPPRPDIGQDADLRDAELVLAAREIEGWDERTPVVVAGDLNDVAWSGSTRLFQRLSGLLDPRIGRGTFATFHAEYPLLRFPLDHVFHSDEFTLSGLRLLDKVGSDHLPICIELSLEAGARDRQDEPEAHAYDHERAEDVVEDRREREEEETEGERRVRNHKDR